MTTRRSFFQVVTALVPALAMPSIAKPKTIRLRDIEREYDPRMGDCGRGLEITNGEFAALDTAGYRPFVTPGTAECAFPVYGGSGLPTGRVWRGYVREDGGRHYVAAVEIDGTSEERSAMLDRPVYGSSGAPLGGTVREALVLRGIDPDHWVSEPWRYSL